MGKQAKIRKAVSLFEKRSSINKWHSSYGLKHVVELYIGEYVSNDELISAMSLAGFDSVAIWNTPNFHFNVTSRSVRKLREATKSLQSSKRQHD